MNVDDKRVPERRSQQHTVIMTAFLLVMYDWLLALHCSCFQSAEHPSWQLLVHRLPMKKTLANLSIFVEQMGVTSCQTSSCPRDNSQGGRDKQHAVRPHSSAARFCPWMLDFVIFLFCHHLRLRALQDGGAPISHWHVTQQPCHQ